MDQTLEFNQCVEELENLRSMLLKSQEKTNEDLLKSTNEMAQKQLSYLQTVNDFLWNLATNSTLKERLLPDNKSIVLPQRDSVINLVKSTKAGLGIYKEIPGVQKCESTVNTCFIEKQRNTLNKFSYGDLSNREYNRNFRNTVQYYNGQSDIEEFGDSTVDTIVSEDVLASSPI